MIEAADGVRLYVEDFGAGVPLVMVCGGNSTHKNWESQVAALAGEFRTITFDWRGTGLSDKPRTGYTGKAAAADVEALVDRLDLAPAILVGHGLGAHLALLVAYNSPRKVRGLFLTAAACAPAAPSQSPTNEANTARAVPNPNRTLAVMTHVEPNALSEHVVVEATGSTPSETMKLFSAGYTTRDERGTPRFDGDTRKDGSRRVLDDALDGSPRFLRARRGGGEQQAHEDPTETEISFHLSSRVKPNYQTTGGYALAGDSSARIHSGQSPICRDDRTGLRDRHAAGGDLVRQVPRGAAGGSRRQGSRAM